MTRCLQHPRWLNYGILWDKLGGILFRIAAIIILIGAAFPRYALVFILAPVIAAAIIATVYSAMIWKKLKTD